MAVETVGRRVARIAKEKFGWSSARLAKEARVSSETLRKWKADLTRPNRRRAEELAKLLQVSVELVMYGAESTSSVERAPFDSGDNVVALAATLRLVPLLDWAEAGADSGGVPDRAFDEVIRQDREAAALLPCPVAHGPRTFALKVTGDSMLNPGSRHSYAEGDIIFVDPDVEAKPGDRCVVRIEGHPLATFKQLVVEDDRRLLKALNPEWKPRYTDLDDRAKIVGVVIGRWVPE
jgi:SOS-response transcriptional repressor LexA